MTGAAERAAELIADEHGLLRLTGDGADGRKERAVGVEDGVAVVLPHTAVELVGAAVDGDVDDGAGGAAELGGVVVGLHAELVDGVRRGRDGLVGEALVRGAVGVVVHTVEKEVVELRALAVDVEGSVAAGDRLVLEVVAADAGHEGHEVAVGAAVQGQIAHFPLGDDGAGIAGFALKLGGGSGDGNGLRNIADLEGDVHALTGTNVDGERFGD